MSSVAQFSNSTIGSSLEGNSLFLFPPTNKIRIRIFKIINNKYFEIGILIIIIFSSILLALDDPLTESTNISLTVIDEIITVLFIIEAALKIISKGFLLNG